MENKNIKRFILGTSNQHKLKEVNAIANLHNINFELVDKEFNPDENGSTFEENAIIKATLAAKLTNTIAIADDTGLCVEKLNGAPGIYSARYAPTQEERINKLLEELKGYDESERQAHFTCAMAVVSPYGEVLFKTSTNINGFITLYPKGKNGFGYDSVFFIPEENRTMAELTDEQKNCISHRGKALTNVIRYLQTNFC